jgi:16S rRNA (cytidine1402-2'-O)-methyltransferase
LKFHFKFRILNFKLLYLLSSPIGNLQDMSVRFIETLSSLDVLYCEDTRVTGNLLSKLNLKIPLRRFDDQTEILMTKKVLEDLGQGLHVGLISDAGTPAVSDPGYKLIRECIKEGIKIVNIPGPSAVLSALLVSGLPTDHFMFFGFLPKTEAHIKQILEKLMKINEIQKTSFIFFESPFRILKTLGWIFEVLPSASLAVCRELTKMHEEVLRGNASEILQILSSRPGIKGEITVVLSCP